MTERPDLRPDDWDDERLGAAFSARSGATPRTPSTLVEDVVGRAAVRHGSRLGWAPVPAMALVLLLAGVLAGPYIGQPSPRESGLSAGQSIPPESAAADPVLAALGHPMSVSEALALRDGETRAREMVVTGFLSAQPIMFCPFDPGPQNPTRLTCSADRQWLMERPEDLYGTSTTGSNELRAPDGPAFHPSFALVEPPVVPIAEPDNTAPVPVVLLGHFHDRRAALCGGADKSECEATFVVDRVLEDNGRAIPIRTSGSAASTSDRESDVDALIAVPAPNARVVSRQLMTVAEVPGIEPVLADDPVIPFWAHREQLVWLVTGVDLREDVPIPRTFMLLDGINWFAEITAEGAQMLERTGPRPSGRPSPLAPTAQPGSFDSAPTSVFGIRVRSIREVADLRRGDQLPGYRDEYAIRGVLPRAPPWRLLRAGAAGDARTDPRHATRRGTGCSVTRCSSGSSKGSCAATPTRTRRC